MEIIEKRKQYLKEWREKNREKRNNYLAKWRANNRDKINAINKKWRDQNREQINARAKVESKKRAESGYYKKWREGNREKYRKYHRDYYHNHNRKAQVLAATRKRQIQKLAATPSWLTKNHIKDIEQIYIQASESGLTVDHIVPLQGEKVCGLHVPWNLQLLSHSDNSRKGNRFEV